MNKEEILIFGLKVFNNEKDKFDHWLKVPNEALGNKIPNDLLETKDIKQVELILYRIEYGIFS